MGQEYDDYRDSADANMDGRARAKLSQQRYYTAGELSRLLNINRTKIYEEAQRIPGARKLMNIWRFKIADVERWLDSGVDLMQYFYEPREYTYEDPKHLKGIEDLKSTED